VRKKSGAVWIAASVGLLSLAVPLTPASAFSAPARSAFFPPASFLSIHLTLPAAGLDFDEGLDVRDANNRPVRSPEARAQLRQLFVDTVYALLTRPELPRMAELLSSVENAWTGARRFLGRAAQAVIALWEQTGWFPTRRFPLSSLSGSWAGFEVAPTRTVHPYRGLSSPRLLSLLTLVSSVVILR
jgi:hypothetical protein